MVSRVLDDARVGHQQARDIRPVLIDIGTGAASHDGPGDVGAPAREGLDRSVRQRSVEAGNHGAGGTRQPFADRVLSPLGVEAAVGVEVDDVGRVHELVAQQIRHQQPVQVLAAARRVVLPGTRRQLLADLVQVGVQVQTQTQIRDDLQVPLPDRLENRVGRLTGTAALVAGVEHVRHLHVVRAALSRRRRHHKAPFGIGLDDRLDLPQLPGVSHAGPTKLTSLQSHFSLSPFEFSFPQEKRRALYSYRPFAERHPRGPATRPTRRRSRGTPARRGLAARPPLPVKYSEFRAEMTLPIDTQPGSRPRPV